MEDKYKQAVEHQPITLVKTKVVLVVAPLHLVLAEAAAAVVAELVDFQLHTPLMCVAVLVAMVVHLILAPARVLRVQVQELFTLAATMAVAVAALTH
jgi:hypothetical protein